MAGLVPAIPTSEASYLPIGITGTSPVMTRVSVVCLPGECYASGRKPRAKRFQFST
jgi:hypothetical protein